MDADPKSPLQEGRSSAFHAATCSVLPVPFYRDEYVTIYHGDSREIVPMLGRFDLMLTDPPYGLAEKLVGGTWGKAFEGKYKDWDAEAPCLEHLMQAADKSIVWGGNYFTLPPSRCWLVWDKPEKMPTVADCEMAWCSWDANSRVFKKSRNPDGKRQHPTQKPLALMQWCIQQAGKVETILDPFAGSGTTGHAAKNLGKRAVLIEREERYCEVAAARLAQDVLPFHTQNVTSEGSPPSRIENKQEWNGDSLH
jgi:site-specific DNA-methyltransferase (adenine-specific)